MVVGQLGEVWYPKKCTPPKVHFKISQDLFDGKNCLCVHLYSDHHVEMILSAAITVGRFVAHIDADILSVHSRGIGTGVCEWNKLLDTDEGLVQNGKVMLKVDVYQHTNQAEMTVTTDSDPVSTFIIDNLKGLTAIAIGLNIFGIPGEWKILAHKDSKGQLMLRLECERLPQDVPSVKLKMKANIRDEQGIDYSDTDVQTFTDKDTNDMVFEKYFVDQHEKAVIKYVVQLVE